MGIIPFLGDSSDDDKSEFNKGNLSDVASQANLDRSEAGDGDREVAEMHKSRSKEAFQNGEHFNDSSSEWRKMTEAKKQNDDRGLSENDLGLQAADEDEDVAPEARGDSEEREVPDFSQTEASRENLENESNENEVEASTDTQPDSGAAGSVAENSEDIRDETPVAAPEEANNEKSEDEASENGAESGELSDSLEENIKSIKDEIGGARETTEEIEEDESIEDAVERFEEIAEKFDFDDEDFSIEGVSEEEFEEFKEDLNSEIDDLREDLNEVKGDQYDLAEEADNRLEEVEEKVEGLESKIGSEEEDGIRVEGVDTAERLEELEEEIEALKSEKSRSEDTEAEVNASEEIHMKALENEVKELREDVKELSEAVVTISQKVFK